jgi:hypothetical protein
VTYDFEQVANEVCEKACLDYDDWNEKRRELVSYFQGRWCDFVDQELSTEEAEKRVLEMFGDVRKAAKSLRRPCLNRLLFYKRYRAERYIAFLTASLLTSWLGAVDACSATHLEKSAVSIEYALGYFFNGYFALGALAVITWKPKTHRRWLRYVLGFRYVLVPFILTGLFNALAAPTMHLLMRPAFFFRGGGIYEIYFGIEVANVFLGMLGGACFISELLGLPRRRGKHRTLAVP